MEANTNEIRDRIKIVMNHVGKNSITFSEEIGIQQSTLSHILNGRNRPSLDVIMKIHERYPQISFDWLINGNGEMENTTVASSGDQETMVNRSSGSYNASLYNNIGIGNPEGQAGMRSYMGTASPTPSESAPFVVGSSKPRAGMSDLFEQGIEPPMPGASPVASAHPIYQSDERMAPSMPPKEVIKYVEKPCKKITEIIIYYDDNTWEKFTCGQ